MRALRLAWAGIMLAACIFVAPGASAADFRVPSLVNPAYHWSGLYLGLHAGHASAKASGVSFDGLLGGITVGFNYQFSQLVLGIEGDIAATDISTTSTGTLFGFVTSGTNRTYALGTARARVGLAFERVLIYGTGGFAWSGNSITGTVLGLSVTDAKIHTGYVYGLGAEFQFLPRWTSRAELLRVHLGSEPYFSGMVRTGDIDATVVRLGVGYLFR
jgi:outer membrane immunogenic protein